MLKTLVSMISLIVIYSASSAAAEDISGLWSYGLTSIRTGDPLIENGGQHRIDHAVVEYGYNIVVDKDGNTQSPQARPLLGGEQLVRSEIYIDDANMREYARIVSYMAAIRDAILYDFEEIDRETWLSLTEILTINEVKTVGGSGLGPAQILTTAQVWDYVASNPSQGSPVMRYLEEAGLELKCLAFKNFNFINPQGGNHCKEHDIPQGKGLVLP